MPAVSTDPAAVVERISDAVRSPFAVQLTAAYFDAKNGFAGALFDGLDPSGLLSDNPPDRFAADDIVAASLLDVRFGPVAIRTLLTDTDVNAALAAVPQQVALWEASDDDLTAATRLWDAVRAVPGVGRTRASKLLARKRPDLVPIVDSVIARALALHDETWQPLAETLRSEHLRRDIENLCPATVSSGLSLLRLLDVVVWTTHSRSASAVRLQQAAGAPTTRDLTRRRNAT